MLSPECLRDPETFESTAGMLSPKDWHLLQVLVCFGSMGLSYASAFSLRGPTFFPRSTAAIQGFPEAQLFHVVLFNYNEPLLPQTHSTQNPRPIIGLQRQACTAPNHSGRRAPRALCVHGEPDLLSRYSECKRPTTVLLRCLVKKVQKHGVGAWG